MFNLSRNLNMPKVEEDKDVTAVEANVTTEETQVEAVENETPAEENVETTPAEETEEEVVVEDTAKESANTSDIDHIILDGDSLKFELYEGFAIEGLFNDDLSDVELEAAEEGRIADFFASFFKNMREKDDAKLSTNKNSFSFSNKSLATVKKNIQKFDNVQGIEKFMDEFDDFSKKILQAITDMKDACATFKTARETFEASAKEEADKKKFQTAVDKFKKEMNRAQKKIKIPIFISSNAKSILSASANSFTGTKALKYEINSNTLNAFTSWVIEVDKMLKERHEELVKERESRLTTNATKIAAKESLESIPAVEGEGDCLGSVIGFSTLILSGMIIIHSLCSKKQKLKRKSNQLYNWLDRELTKSIAALEETCRSMQETRISIKDDAASLKLMDKIESEYDDYKSFLIDKLNEIYDIHESSKSKADYINATEKFVEIDKLIADRTEKFISTNKPLVKDFLKRNGIGNPDAYIKNFLSSSKRKDVIANESAVAQKKYDYEPPRDPRVDGYVNLIYAIFQRPSWKEPITKLEKMKDDLFDYSKDYRNRINEVNYYRKSFPVYCGKIGSLCKSLLDKDRANEYLNKVKTQKENLNNYFTEFNDEKDRLKEKTDKLTKSDMTKFYALYGKIARIWEDAKEDFENIKELIKKDSAKESVEEIKNEENEDMNSGIPTYESYIMNCMSVASESKEDSDKTPSKKPLTKKEYLIAMTSEKVKNDPELKKLIISGKMTREELVNMDIIKEPDDVASKKKEEEKATESVTSTPAEEAVDPAVAFLGIYSGSVIGLLGIAAAIGAHKTKKKNKKAYAEISADLKTMLANIDAGIAEAEDYKEKNKSDKDAEKLADKVIKAYTSYRVFIASQLETLDTIKAMKKKEENNFEKYQDYLSIANEVINKSKKFMSDNAANIKELAKKTGVEDADKYLKDLIKSSKYAREYKRNNILVANESVAEEAKDNSDYNWKTNFNDGVKKVTEMIKAAQKSDNTNEKEDSLNHASREVGELKDKIENLDLETYKNIPGIKGDTEADLAEYKETKKSLIEKLEKEIDNMNNVATESYTKEEVTEFLKSFGLDENGNDIATEAATTEEVAEEGKVADSLATARQNLNAKIKRLKEGVGELNEAKKSAEGENIKKRAKEAIKEGNQVISSTDVKVKESFVDKLSNLYNEIKAYVSSNKKEEKATESLTDEDQESLALLADIDAMLDIDVATEGAEETTDEDETVEEATESAAEEEAAYQSAIDELEEALLS